MIVNAKIFPDTCGKFRSHDGIEKDIGDAGASNMEAFMFGSNSDGFFFGIAYGVFISRGLFLDAKQPVNVFANIDENVDELKEIGQRIIMQGAEMVRFSLLE